MATYKSTSRLSAPLPSKTSTVQSTTSSLSQSLESHPEEAKWWAKNYGIGPRKQVKQLTQNIDAFKYRKLGFKVGSFPVEDVDFGDALLVACGPRVSLYGGRVGMTSEFNRRLDGKKEKEVDLFGGKGGGDDDGGKLDDISADRQFSTGGHLATAVCNRSDKRLVAVGTEGGTIRLCDANSRATLRSFSSSRDEGGGDRKSIRDVCWMRDGKRIVAGGDDGVVRVWNVGSENAEFSLIGHGDSVRCVGVVSYRTDGEPKRKDRKGLKADNAFQSDWNQLLVSGSYDHTIRTWDISRASQGERCTSVMDHGDPVQALLILPPVDSSYGLQKAPKTKYDNIPLLVSAGGTTLKIWNPLTGTCIGTYATKHAKTITCLCLLDMFDDSGEDSATPQRKRQIVTGGLDGLLRIHSATPQDIVSGSLPFLHGMQFTSPISALSFSQDMSRLAIGFTTGTVMVHQRRKFPNTQPEKRREPKPGTYSYFMRGGHEKTHDPDDYLLPQQKKQKLSEYDNLLRKFRYGAALDKVLETRQPQNVIAVIEELGKRRGLSIALSNRDEESLESILSFTIRFIDNPQYTSYLIGVVHILIDIYGFAVGQSSLVDELFTKLKAKVGTECAVQKNLLRLLGQIDYVMAGADAEK